MSRAAPLLLGLLLVGAGPLTAQELAPVARRPGDPLGPRAQGGPRSVRLFGRDHVANAAVPFRRVPGADLALDQGEPWEPFEPTSWDQLVAMMPYQQLRFEPGTRYGYSNPGFVYLARVI